MHLRCRKLLDHDLLVQKGRFESVDAPTYYLKTQRGSLLLVREGVFALGYFWREVQKRLLSGDTSDLRSIARDLSRYVGRGRALLDLYDSEYPECAYRLLKHNVTVVFQKTHMNLVWFRGELPLSNYSLSLLPGDILFYSSRLSHGCKVRFKEGLKLSPKMP